MLLRGAEYKIELRRRSNVLNLFPSPHPASRQDRSGMQGSIARLAPTPVALAQADPSLPDPACRTGSLSGGNDLVGPRASLTSRAVRWATDALATTTPASPHWPATS